MEETSLLSFDNFQPDSPRFKGSEIPSPLELECASLRRLVQFQQQ